MRKNTSLFYWALLAVAVSVPMLMQVMGPKEAAKNTTLAPKAQTVPSPTPSTNAPRAKAAKAPPVEEQTYLIETQEFSARVSNVSGGIKSFRLKDEQFENKGHATEHRHDRQASVLPADVSRARRRHR